MVQYLSNILTRINHWNSCAYSAKSCLPEKTNIHTPENSHLLKRWSSNRKLYTYKIYLNISKYVLLFPSFPDAEGDFWAWFCALSFSSSSHALGPQTLQPPLQCASHTASARSPSWTYPEPMHDTGINTGGTKPQNQNQHVSGPEKKINLPKMTEIHILSFA